MKILFEKSENAITPKYRIAAIQQQQQVVLGGVEYDLLGNKMENKTQEPVLGPYQPQASQSIAAVNQTTPDAQALLAIQASAVTELKNVSLKKPEYEKLIEKYVLNRADEAIDFIIEDKRDSWLGKIAGGQIKEAERDGKELTKKIVDKFKANLSKEFPDGNITVGVLQERIATLSKNFEGGKYEELELSDEDAKKIRKSKLAKNEGNIKTITSNIQTSFSATNLAAEGIGGDDVLKQAGVDSKEAAIKKLKEEEDARTAKLKKSVEKDNGGFGGQLKEIFEAIAAIFQEIFGGGDENIAKETEEKNKTNPAQKNYGPIGPQPEPVIAKAEEKTAPTKAAVEHTAITNAQQIELPKDMVSSLAYSGVSNAKTEVASNNYVYSADVCSVDKCNVPSK